MNDSFCLGSSLLVGSVRCFWQRQTRCERPKKNHHWRQSVWLLRHTAALPTDRTMNHQCNSKQKLPVSSEEPQRLLADRLLQPRWQQPTAPLNYRLQPWLLFYIKISSPNEGITVTVIYTQLNNGSLKLKGAVFFFLGGVVFCYLQGLCWRGWKWKCRLASSTKWSKIVCNLCGAGQLYLQVIPTPLLCNLLCVLTHRHYSCERVITPVLAFSRVYLGEQLSCCWRASQSDDFNMSFLLSSFIYTL